MTRSKMEEILTAVFGMLMGITKQGIIQAQGEIDSEGKSYVWTFTLREKVEEGKEQ